MLWEGSGESLWRSANAVTILDFRIASVTGRRDAPVQGGRAVFSRLDGRPCEEYSLSAVLRFGAAAITASPSPLCSLYHISFSGRHGGLPGEAFGAASDHIAIIG